MASTYTVEKTPEVDSNLGNAGANSLKIRVSETDARGTLGRVEISRGGIDFYRGQATKEKSRMTWAQFFAQFPE